ncbi:hypothetical protein CSAL01_05659 [Colletotrichum salicis]|uniref:Uncharacterized protein n=1 Tax=Colletotrichum salicis TaxID=1209931 RepID=A0A135TJJ8_9PEZI|nr:hypothetical protein CSAL01_05659 [Colletotrichum salicis]
MPPLLLRPPHPLHPLSPSLHKSQPLIRPPIHNNNRHRVLMRPPDLQRLPEPLRRPRSPHKSHLDPLRINLFPVRSPVQRPVGGRSQVDVVFEPVAWARRIGTPARYDLGLDLAVEEGAVFGLRSRGQRGGEGPFYLAVGPEPGSAAVVVHVSVKAAAFAEGNGFGTHCWAGFVLARDCMGDLRFGLLLMSINGMARQEKAIGRSAVSRLW